MPLVVAVLALGACRHGTGTEKGGLVTVQASAQDATPAFAGRRFALLVGINQAGDERWRTLRFAKKDAKDLAAVLADPARGGFAQVRVLTEPAETTTAALRREVAALARLATNPDDVVLLYVSAHGTLEHDGRGELRRYLVTADAEFHRVSQTALSVDELVALAGQGASRRRVVVLATCHSGGGKSVLTEAALAELASRKGPGVIRPLEEASRAALVLSASDFGEVAREDEQLRNDVYTHFLVEALGGVGDRNGDGAVSATEAHDFARRRTWHYSQGRQRPSAELVEVGADPVFLSGRLTGAGQPELYSYAARLDGFSLTVDGAPRGELPGGAAVPEGRHRVELTKGGDVLLADEVRLRAGERLDLDSLVRKKEPWLSVAVLGGALGFLDARSRDEVLPTVPSMGLALRADRVGLDALSIGLDVSGFSGVSALSLGGGAPVPFQWTSVVAGVSGLLRWDVGRLSLWGGPRVAGWLVQRSFSLEAYSKQQSAFTVSPGLLLGGVVRLTERWEVSVNSQVMVTLLTVDGAVQVLGFAGGWLAVGYRL